MRQHVTMLGSLLIAHGIIGLIVAAIVFVSIAGGGLLSGDADAMMITGTVGVLVGGFLVAISLPGFVAGFGVLGFRPWARVLAMIACILALLGIPLGTALGIYGIWVLMKPETAELFQS